MIGGILVSIILLIMIAAQIATTLSTAKELSKLRRVTQKNHTTLAALQTRVGGIERDLQKCSRAVERANKRGIAWQKMPGDLDLYHGGRRATVQAVFRPRDN